MKSKIDVSKIDEDVLMEIVALADKLMGEEFGESKKPKAMAIEIQKAEPMGGDKMEAIKEVMEAKAEMPEEMSEEDSEDDDEFELKRKGKIY